MNIIARLQRKIANSDAGNPGHPRNTIGELFRKIKGLWQWFCYTLEDEIRMDGIKVYGETCLEAGIYELRKGWWNAKGRVVIELFPTFETKIKFSKVYMHGGNDEDDTLACPLIAYNINKEQTRIQGTAEDEWTKWVLEQLKHGKCYISIENKQIVGELNKQLQ